MAPGNLDPERPLREQLAERARILNAVPCGVKVIDLEPLRLTYWNQGCVAMYGYTAEEALGQHPGELLKARFELPVEEITARLMRDGSWRGEAIETRKDGVEIVTDLRLALQRDEAGRPTSVINIATDITAEKAVLVELARSRDLAEAANAAKSQFLATMSHELRTPLNAILGYSEMLMEDAEAEGRDEAAADLQKIRAAGRHLLGLIEEVLDLARIETGNMEIHREPVDVAAMLDAVVAIGLPLARQGGNELRLHVAPDVGIVVADRKRLEQVVLNLTSNACKFTQGGVVALAAWRDAGEVSIGVRDTGMGIAPELLGRLFQPFVQGDAALTRRHGGTGLGLAIARQLCELMGATIDLASTPGQGSTFVVRLPAQTDARTV